MASLEELERGLMAADAAGNGADAKVFADEIRKLRGEEAPSMFGSFAREGARSALPAGAGFLGGAGAGAAAGLAGGPFAPITVPAAALVGGIASAFGARKLQDVVADEVAPDSFMGTKSAALDYETNPGSTFSGGLVVGGKPSVGRVISAGKAIGTTAGREGIKQVAGTLGKQEALAALRQTAQGPAAVNAFGDVLDVASGAGIGAGLSAASGESPAMILANLAGGAVFNKPWIGGSNAVLPRDGSVAGNGPMIAPAENGPTPTTTPPVVPQGLPASSPMTTPLGERLRQGPMPQEVPLSAGPGADPKIQAALDAFFPTIDPTRPTVAPMAAQQPPDRVPLQFEQPMTKRQLAETIPQELPAQMELPVRQPVPVVPESPQKHIAEQFELPLAAENAAQPIKKTFLPNEPNPATPELQQGLPAQELPPPQLADTAAPALPERGGVPGDQAPEMYLSWGERGGKIVGSEKATPIQKAEWIQGELAKLGTEGKEARAIQPGGQVAWATKNARSIKSNTVSQVRSKKAFLEGEIPSFYHPQTGEKISYDAYKEANRIQSAGVPVRPSEDGRGKLAMPDNDTRGEGAALLDRSGTPGRNEEPLQGDVSLRQKLQSTSDRLGESIRSDVAEGRVNMVLPGLDGTTIKRVYKLGVDTALAAIDTGAKIGKAVNQAIQTIKADLGARWRPEMAAEIKREITKNLPGEIDKRRQVVQQTADTARKVAVGDVKEGAPKPSEAEFKQTLTEKLPDQKPLIDADKEPQAIYDEPAMKPGDYPDEGKKTDWQDYNERTGERVERAVEDLKSGKTAKEIGQKVGSLRRELFTSKSAIAHEVADGALPGTTKSEAAKEFINDVMGTVPGADGVAKNGADADFIRDTTKRVNVLDGIYRGLQPRMERMSSNDRRVFLRRIGDLLTNEKADLTKEPSDVRKAIEGVRDFFQKAQMDLHQAGYDLGDFGEFSMPRIYDAAKRANNPEAFHRDLVKTYEAKFAREIKAAEDAGDDVLLHKLREKYQPGEALKRALAYERNLAMNDAGISTSGDDFKLGDNDGVPNFLKAREFGEEADRLLGEYYVRDPFEVAKLTAENTERLITMARVLGKVDPKTGTLERLGRWNDLRDKLMAEDNGQMVPELARVIASTFGLGERVGPKTQKFGEFTRTWMWLSFLDRAAVSSLAEPLMAGISTRSVGEAAKAFGKTIKQSYRRLAKLPPNESQIIAEALGYVQSGILSRMAAAHASDPFASGGMAKTADGFFRMTGLTGWTHSTAEAVSDIGFEHLAALSRLAKTSKLAARDLESFGVGPAEIDTLRGFADNMGNDRVGKILGNSPGAAIMRKAHAVYMRRTSINPTQGDKALHASHPVGQMFYGLQSYLYSYTKNVTAKLLRDARTAATSKDLSPAERAKLGAMLPAALLGMGAANFGITMLREALFQDPERKKKDAKKKPGEITKGRLLASASRANFLGPYDPIFNAITAAKYQRDPATVMVGPVWGAASELFGLMASQGGDRDSPNTNTAERKIGRLAYQIGVKPATSAFLSGLPATRAAGLANYAISHPATRETFVRGTVGAPNAKERGKSAKKGPMPGNF